jgi:NAD(P)-dependent dehydrogenase (short-subunit alcohol dehydrogenase family)
MSEKKIWFITGTSSGLGRELAEEVLAQGYRVVATARTPEVLKNLIEKYPQTARAVKLDVTNLVDVKISVNEALEAFGRIDVLVNNAGYGLVGAIEEASDAQIRQQFETNVFGVLNVLREVLPVLREQKSGHILNISSRLGFFAFPSYGFYSATKFALHGLSEALAQEVAPHGIKVTIVEPGGLRTDFVQRSMSEPENVLPEAYPSTASILNRMHEADGKQSGDPRKAARLMIEIVESENPPLHLPLGEDSYTRIEEQLDKLRQEISLWREKGIATSFEAAAA